MPNDGKRKLVSEEMLKFETNPKKRHLSSKIAATVNQLKQQREHKKQNRLEEVYSFKVLASSPSK